MRHVVLLTAILLASGSCKKDKDPDPTTTDPEETGDTGAAVDADLDGDGFSVAEGDCDDADDAVFPGADEVCDGVDNDCDEATDEEPIDGIPFYTDADRDGYGAGDAIVACQPIPDASLQGDDCDDADDTIHPMADELPCTRVSESCGTYPDADLVVPTDHATLQEAVDAADDGAVVCVEAGTYPFVVVDHPLTLASFDGPEETVIDGEGTRRAIQLFYAPGTLIQGFTVQNGYAMTGGAGLIVLLSDDSVVRDVTFVGHLSDTQGAALQEDQNRGLLVSSCRFEANRAMSGAAYSGIGSDGTVFRDCVFDRNVADQGGALDLGFHEGSVRVEHSTFTDNEASSGGAILTTGGVALTVVDSSFSGHDVLQHGGALYAVLTSEPVVVTDSVFVDNSAADGGALFASDSDGLEVTGSTFEDNTAANLGGAIRTSYTDTVELEGNRFEANRGGGGGAAWLEGADTISSTDDRFVDNRGSNSLAGAVFAEAGSVVVTGSVFEGNTTGVGGSAGGMLIAEGQSVVVSGASFEGNSTGGVGAGGGLAVFASLVVDISDTVFDANLAPQTEGGGLLLSDVTTASISDCTFTDNFAAASGGGASLSHIGALTVRDTVVLDNVADRGAGFSTVDVTSVDVVDGEITGNNAGSFGGGIYCDSCTMDLSAAFIHDNLPTDLWCNACNGCSL